MNVSVLFFGITKEKTGFSNYSFNLDPQSDLRVLEEELFRKFPKLKSEITFKFAVNNEYILGNQVLNNGDEVALIPPVSGG
ncbi:MAG: MoaD/ThiS family protein [Bacteroidota bacterium]